MLLPLPGGSVGVTEAAQKRAPQDRGMRCRRMQVQTSLKRFTVFPLTASVKAKALKHGGARIWVVEGSGETAGRSPGRVSPRDGRSSAVWRAWLVWNWGICCGLATSGGALDSQLCLALLSAAAATSPAQPAHSQAKRPRASRQGAVLQSWRPSLVTEVPEGGAVALLLPWLQPQFVAEPSCSVYRAGTPPPHFLFSLPFWEPAVGDGHIQEQPDVSGFSSCSLSARGLH